MSLHQHIADARRNLATAIAGLKENSKPDTLLRHSNNVDAYQYILDELLKIKGKK